MRPGDRQRPRARAPEADACRGITTLPRLREGRENAATALANRVQEQELADKALVDATARAQRISKAQAQEQAWRDRLAEAVRQIAEWFELGNQTALAAGGVAGCTRGARRDCA